MILTLQPTDTALWYPSRRSNVIGLVFGWFYMVQVGLDKNELNEECLY
jgi:hypothetical protein